MNSVAKNKTKPIKRREFKVVTFDTDISATQVLNAIDECLAPNVSHWYADEISKKIVTKTEVSNELDKDEDDLEFRESS